MNEKLLVSFGNFLLENREVESNGVTHADLENWKINSNYSARILPSRHQLGDIVEVSFLDSGKITKAKVIKIAFTEGKVSYDLEISGNYDSESLIDDQWHTRIYNIDSVFVDQHKLLSK